MLDLRLASRAWQPWPPSDAVPLPYTRRCLILCCSPRPRSGGRPRGEPHAPQRACNHEPAFWRDRGGVCLRCCWVRDCHGRERGRKLDAACPSAVEPRFALLGPQPIAIAHRPPFPPSHMLAARQLSLARPQIAAKTLAGQKTEQWPLAAPGPRWTRPARMGPLSGGAVKA